MFKILMLSIALFSTATELRLNSVDHQCFSQLDKEVGSPFLEAEMYHLLAIIAVAALVPMDILYLSHVINSYTNYFNSGLVDYKTVETESLEKIIELVSDVRFKSPQPGST